MAISAVVGASGSGVAMALVTLSISPGSVFEDFDTGAIDGLVTLARLPKERVDWAPRADGPDDFRRAGGILR